MHDATRHIEIFERKNPSFEGTDCTNDAVNYKDGAFRKFGKN